MLSKAFAKISENTNVIIHSDQDWQYQMKKISENAYSESFFGRLKTEFFYDRVFESVDDFIVKLENYIGWYNNGRIKSRLSMSPVKYRLLIA